MTIRIRRSSGAPVVLGDTAERAEEAPARKKGGARAKAARGGKTRAAGGAPASRATPGVTRRKLSRSRQAERAGQMTLLDAEPARSPSEAPGTAKKRAAAAGEAPVAPPPVPDAAATSEPVRVTIPAAPRADDSPPDQPAALEPAPRTTPRRRATAESMAAKQRDISVSEFFMKNRHLLGFDSPARALLTTAKEAIDNSLDAAEEAGILPNLKVDIVELAEDRYRVVVEDNGPGIVKAQVPKVFGKLLYGSKFHRLRQARGQQGIGISAAGMYGQLTTGKPIVITSKTGKGRPAHHFEIVIDASRNTPVIVKDETIDWEPDHGTRVEIELQGTYKAGRRSVDEYLEELAIANPHAEITYRPPRDRPVVHLPRATNELPREPLEIKPHPYGVELGTLQRLLKETEAKTLSAALQGEFSRVTPKVSEEILRLAGLAPRARPHELKPAEIERLHRVIPKVKIFAPPTACVVPIGEELIRKGLEREIKAEFYTSSTRPPAVYRGNPFQVEAGLAYGGELRSRDEDEASVHDTSRAVDAQQGPITLLRLANRVPLQHQQSACAIFKAAVDTNWRAYGLSQPKGSLPQGPMVLLVHMASVWVPFTSEAKEAVAHYPEILREMQLALQDCGRKLGAYLRKREQERHKQRRRSIFEMYIGELVESLGKLTPVNRQKLQQDLLVMARRHTGDAEADVEADSIVKPTKRVAKRDDELDEEEMP